MASLAIAFRQLVKKQFSMEDIDDRSLECDLTFQTGVNGTLMANLSFPLPKHIVDFLEDRLLESVANSDSR